MLSATVLATCASISAMHIDVHGYNLVLKSISRLLLAIISSVQTDCTGNARRQYS